jgi:UDP-N-acetylmuramate--alanine ligase
MNTLARFLLSRGDHVGGSDREFDRGLRPGFYRSLQSLGITLHPQDGSGVVSGIDRVIISTAVESKVPDIARANELRIPVVHRATELAEHMNQCRSIAIAGTSGKSSVTAMIAWLMTQAGLDPTVMNGASIPGFGPGAEDADFRAGGTDWAVFEADESDGSLMLYRPFAGLIHNISKDHKSLEELRAIFSSFARNVTGKLFVNADCSESMKLTAGLNRVITYGFNNPADYKAGHWQASAWGSSFAIGDRLITFNHPGYHNAMNALAAFAVASELGIEPEISSTQLRSFPGIRRRFEKIGVANGVIIVDDYAHNPDKIRWSLRTAKSLATRIIAIYQPHGFGPTRFLFRELVDVFASETSSSDSIIFMPIFYAGGSVSKDICSEHLTREIEAAGRRCRVLDREALAESIKELSRPGDLILVMGARDPSLPDFCRELLEKL